MKNITDTYPKPPTKKMLEKLKDCLDKNNHQITVPCLPNDLKSSLAGLYKRGLIETKMQLVNEKKMLCVYVTAKGKKLLEELEKND